jgi:endoglucanase
MITLLAFALATMPPLHVDGPNLKDPSGQVVNLRGCNLGNWLVMEPWMWDQQSFPNEPKDQYEMEGLLSQRFGEAEKNRLMDLYHRSWITDRDFAIIQNFRFNCARLPMNYRDFEDDATPYHLKPNAFRWVDHAIEMAKSHGVYLILDMHGPQGGQSKEVHTGRRDQNLLWTTPEDQKRLAWLWARIAEKYRSESDVVAYDAFNEPYGGSETQIPPVFQQCYDAIRSVDKEKLIYAHGRYDGFAFYGDPKANGWHNVGIQMHYYPGLFDGGPHTVKNLMQHLNWMRDRLAPQVQKLNVPFLVGEMNVVFNESGGAPMMRRWYDLDESLGWTTTMWSYKTLKRSAEEPGGSWGMVSNAEPFQSVDFATAPEADIEHFFAEQATMPYKVNQALEDWLAPKTVNLPAYSPTDLGSSRTKAPNTPIPNWSAQDVGSPLSGGQDLVDATHFSLYGGGSDIWGSHDAFRYLYRPLSYATTLTATITSMEALGSYCKGGLMVRGGLTDDASFALLSVFPEGGLQFTVRKEKGGAAVGSSSIVLTFPATLRLTVSGHEVQASYRDSSGDWKSFGDPQCVELGASPLAGVVACSHDDSQLLKVGYSDLVLR